MFKRPRRLQNRIARAILRPMSIGSAQTDISVLRFDQNKFVVGDGVLETRASKSFTGEVVPNCLQSFTGEVVPNSLQSFTGEVVPNCQ